MDSVLANSGYISTRRSRQQSLQQSYINQAVLREVINKHPMCILFQNDVRLRSGKLAQPVTADMGVLWLMQTYLTSLQSSGKNVHLVPVCINYERVFEVRNLAIEMVSGKVPRLSFMKLLNMLSSEKEGKLGRAFVNYGRVINLREYLKNISIPQINQQNIDDSALRISEKLYKEQQHMTAANLSHLVSCVLLQEQAKSVTVSSVLASCNKLFKFLKKRNVNSTMTLSATKDSIINIIKRLGFKLQKLAVQPKGKNDEMEVVLSAREDQKTLLSLSYYSNMLVMQFIMDCCICYILTPLFAQGKSIKVADLIEKVKIVYSVLRYEFIEKLKQRPVEISV